MTDRVVKQSLTTEPDPIRDEYFERLVPVNASPSEAFNIAWRAARSEPVSKRYKLGAA